MIDPRYDYKELHTERASGVLLPLFALPSPYGIGSIGPFASAFVDFLRKAGQKYWQLLPIGPTGYGNSPYSSMSSFAGNPYFIDLDALQRAGLLTQTDIGEMTGKDSTHAGRIDYGALYRNRLPLLKKAYCRFTAHSAHRELLHVFLTEQADWLDDYALFSAIRSRFGEGAWYRWPEDIRKRTPQAMAAAWKELQEPFYFAVFLQYLFQKQWDELKAYANQAGVQLIGDIPIYCAHDSADVWAHPEVFCLNKDGSLGFVGGCPPADFDITGDFGQVWGTPVYDWAYLDRTGFAWLLARFKRQAYLYDVVRLDHFRGYESYWRIPFGGTGRDGSWEPAGGEKLFSLVQREIPTLRIIAEDLGYITKQAFHLRCRFGYSGMRILQQGLNPFHANEHTPHHYDAATVLYFGIHDNEPFSVWLAARTEEEKAYFFDYLNLNPADAAHPISLQLIKAMAASIANTVIYQAQDILFLGSESRINVPGRADGNWEFMLTPEQFGQLTESAAPLAHVTKLYGRQPKPR